MGLTSYYRQFIKGFAHIAQPLHKPTQKVHMISSVASCLSAIEGVSYQLPSVVLSKFWQVFHTRDGCQSEWSPVRMVSVLFYPKNNLIIIKLHPAAYASCALSPTEKWYAITDLGALAVVWAVTHFHAYLYGRDVLVYTDHSAVRAVLETTSPSGKHARWWSKLFSSGLRSIKILYHPGKENACADALSRNPALSGTANDNSVQIAHLESSSLAITDLLDAKSVQPSSVDLWLLVPYLVMHKVLVSLTIIDDILYFPRRITSIV